MRLFIPSGRVLKCNNNIRQNYNKAMLITIAYIAGMVVWTILIAFLTLFNHDIVCTILLFIPYIIFFFGIIDSKYITVDMEDKFFSSNFLSVGLLVFLPLLTRMESTNKANNSLFITLCVLAL